MLSFYFELLSSKGQRINALEYNSYKPTGTNIQTANVLSSINLFVKKFKEQLLQLHEMAFSKECSSLALI